MTVGAVVVVDVAVVPDIVGVVAVVRSAEPRIVVVGTKGRVVCRCLFSLRPAVF